MIFPFARLSVGQGLGIQERRVKGSLKVESKKRGGYLSPLDHRGKFETQAFQGTSQKKDRK